MWVSRPIETPATAPPGALGPLTEQLAEHLLARLRDPAPLSLAALLAMWGALGPRPCGTDPDLYRLLAARLAKAGEQLVAQDVAARGLEYWPGDVRLHQLRALALARSGATEQANEILRRLLAEGADDGETLGLLARTYKDLWRRATDDANRGHRLRLAHETYARAYRATGQPWHGINAATTAQLGAGGRAAIPG